MADIREEVTQAVITDHSLEAAIQVALMVEVKEVQEVLLVEVFTVIAFSSRDNIRIVQELLQAVPANYTRVI
ncbi:hypothetical protein ABGV42_26890 [Paenibacillus pabuli]